jgi:predicted kinase
MGLVMSSPTSKPHLIVVTGRPAAGKTTLAKLLSKELGVPLICKDRIREVLFERLGWKDRAWAQLLGRASIDLMFHFADAQLEAGCSLIMDNSFAPNVSTPRFQGLQAKHGVSSIQIVCNADAETLFRRFSERVRTGARHPGHGDEAILDELQANLAKESPSMMDLGGPVIQVDTTDFARFDHTMIARQISVILDHTDME